MRILGLDPGLQHTGWGIISFVRGTLSHVAHGVIHTPTKAALCDRLQVIYAGLMEVIALHTPQEAAVEETFVNKNPTSTLKLGMARGIALLAPAQAGLPVGEYSANRVKKTVVGVGHAGKDQVAAMIQRLLPKAGNVTLDAADALAVAICHAHFRESLTAWGTS